MNKAGSSAGTAGNVLPGRPGAALIAPLRPGKAGKSGAPSL
jgi:hypothetical protein